MKSRLPRQWAIAFLVWSVPALLLTIPSLREGDATAGSIFAEALPWLVWALCTPLVLRQARRHRLEPPHRLRDAAAHLATALVITLLHTSLAVAAWFAVGGAPADASFARSWLEGIAVWTPLGLIFYAALASIGFVLAYQQRLRDRDVHAARLEAQLSDARLHALRNQLDPHFLFNTLNTVAMHVRAGDTQTSVRVLARLSELLRHILDEAPAAEVPLGTELAWVRAYLGIEGIRFSDRLRARVDVPESLRDALVPNLLLQPLVENAIRHGIARCPDAGHLEVRADRIHGRLRIEVLNEGEPLPARFEPAAATGVGLRNTAARLAHVHGDAASLRLENRADGMVAAIVELPWRIASAS